MSRPWPTLTDCGDQDCDDEEVQTESLAVPAFGISYDGGGGVVWVESCLQ